MNGQIKNNNQPDDIFIHAAKSNSDFHLELTISYDQKCEANIYSVTGILRAIPNDSFPSEGESESQFDCRLDQIQKTILIDNDKFKAFDDEYSPY